MKSNIRIGVFLLSTLCFFNSWGQNTGIDKEEPPNPSMAVTMGLFQGGGSIVGADIDLLLGKRFGIQAGGGYLGLGGGFLYHVGKPYKINTSAFAFTAWQFGAGSKFSGAYAGPSFIFRAFNFLSIQGGGGIRIARNNETYSRPKATPYSLRFAIGFFLYKNEID
ncbi:MAG: hypothetical protein JXR03_00225 [Cyclobacteriaceae bacterium]